MRYAVVFEKDESNYSAYVPDLPGSVATVEDIEREIKEAIRLHLDGLRQDGAQIPQPSAVCEYVEP